MPTLRSARSRAIIAGVVLVAVLIGIATVAGWRSQADRERGDRLEHASAAAAALERARAQTAFAATWVATSVFADDPAPLNYLYSQAILASHQGIDEARSELLAIGDKEGLAAVDQLGSQMDDLTQELDALWGFALTADRDERIETAQREMARLWPLAMGVIGNLERLAEAQHAQVAADVAAANRTADTTLWLVIGLSAAALAAAAAAGVVAVSLVRPLAALRASARSITAGDSAARAKVCGPEEVASLARDFNEMTDVLEAKTQEYIDTTNLTGDIIVRLDRDGRFTFLNDAACEFYGGARQELLGAEHADYVHPDDLPSIAQLIREGIPRREEVRGFVNRMITPTGTRVVEWNGYPLFDEDGHYAGLQGTGRDITERKQAEEALRESEERLRILFEFAPDAIYLHDLEGNFVDGNRAAEKLTGYKKKELIGKSLLESNLFPPTQLPKAAATVAKLVQSLPSGPDEFTLIRKDGKHIAVETRGFPVQIGAQTVILGIGRDISERKRAEEALRKSEGRYRLLAENVTDVIWAMDTNLRLTYISPSITALRGYSIQEAMDQTLEEMFTPASLRVAKKVILAERAMEESETKDLSRSGTVELEETCKDGSTVWVEAKFAILRDPDGQAIGTLGVTRDISERKRAEEALRENERRFSRLARSTFEGLVIHDRGKILDANPAFARMFGYELSEVIGMHALDFTAPESRELLWRSILSRRLEPFEALGLRKDGSILVCELLGRDIQYQERTATVTAVRDITQRKKAEEALRESEQRFRTLSEATFEAIAIHKRGRILDANQTLADMFGYQLSEVVGRRPQDFVAPESRDLVLYATLSRYEKPFELIGLRKDGSTFPIEACAKATQYQGQTVAVAAVRDISQRKRAEEALQKARDDIESRVERRMQQVNGYGLTFRELAVLHLVAAGKADKEIAIVLGISPLTAQKHVANILGKMGAASRTEAGVRALREGMLD